MYGPHKSSFLDSEGNSKRENSGFSLAKLFDKCIQSNAQYSGTNDTAVESCPATKLTSGSKALTQNVHDYDSHWEMCYLNVPRLAEFCRHDTAGCLETLGPDVCEDPYAPFYSECLVYTGQCKDNPDWRDEFDDDCSYYADKDPGCTAIADRGQRKNCPVTCSTCADPCQEAARTDECSVERLRHWYRGDDWSCKSLNSTDGLECKTAHDCGFCNNTAMPEWSFNVTSPTLSTAVCELAENAVEKVCCYDAGLPCDGNYPPPECSEHCEPCCACMRGLPLLRLGILSVHAVYRC